VNGYESPESLNFEAGKSHGNLIMDINRAHQIDLTDKRVHL